MLVENLVVSKNEKYTVCDKKLLNLQGGTYLRHRLWNQENWVGCK